MMPAAAQPGRCRSCDAPIWWTLSEKTRKRMPLDAEPQPHGNVIIETRAGVPLAVTLRKSDPRREVDTIPKYVSHHATCPHGHAWKRTPSRKRSSSNG